MVLMLPLLLLSATPGSAQVVLKFGDILVAEPGTSSIAVVEPATGAKTVISQGGLLDPANKTIGVALGLDGDIIVVHRLIGLIRVQPLTGAQTILSQGGFFKDPWAIAINKNTGDIYVADSGYDNDRPEINEGGKIIRVNPASGAQELIAVASPCNFFPSGAACQNTTSPGGYLSHPYGLAIDYTASPNTILVSDMSSFNGQGAIIRIQPIPNGTQTLVWGPASAVPAPQVAQLSPVGCPMGIAVEPNGNILATVFTFPVPSVPSIPPPSGTFYGCAPPGIFRIDLASNVQRVLNANAPPWQSNHVYAIGDVIQDAASPASSVHRVVTGGVSQGQTPAWNGTPGGATADGEVAWQNIGPGANWLIPFGVDIEPAPTPSDPSGYNVIVGDEGYSMLFRLDANGGFVSPTPLATNLSNVTSINVIAFTPPPGGGNPGPVRSNGQPVGPLPSGTTQTAIGLTTDVNATCRYSVTSGVPYQSMANTFASTGSVTHSTTVAGLADDTAYDFYVRCIDAAAHANTDDFTISFWVGPSARVTSSFSGVESPLSENGIWDSPGAWADLQKNAGAFAAGLNAQGRLVTPVMSADQISEITYSQDPGASSWVGVTTRVQGPSNGSGYLAIVYAGEVRLYRADDSGSLNFTLLASAAADLSATPRRLRLESQGNDHRVFFNGTQVITYTASGTIYLTGQPGIAASVFGGPQVKILSFVGGELPGAGGNLPVISITNVTVTEGNTGTTNAVFTVTLSAPTGHTVTVDYATANGTAVAPGDYTSRSGVLTYLPGTTTQSITVPVIGDARDEADETFVVNLSAPTNASLAASQATGTITDNDATPSLAIADVIRAEGNSGTANAVFTVTLSAVSGQVVTVAYTTADGTATAPADYTVTNGILSIPAGASSGQINVPVVGDSRDEANETFFLNLSSPTNATLPDAQAIGTITDNDLAPSIVINNVSIAEGNAGSANAVFTVRLSAASSFPVTVNYATADVTAIATVDYAITTGTLSFAPDTTTAEVTVPVLGDLLDELSETFNVNLSAATNATIGDALGVGTITDNDATPTLAITDVAVTEPSSGSTNAVFTVTLSAASGRAVSVNYTTANVTAIAGADYTATAGTLSFPSGVTTREITVPVLDDQLDEASETFQVNLSGVVAAGLADSRGIGTVTDDDPLPTVSISDVLVTETTGVNTTATFTVTLSTPSGRTLSVGYITANGTATSPSDYTARSGTLTFAAGIVTQTFTITIVGDSILEPSETFVVNLRNPSNVTIADGQGVCTIVNND